VILSNGANDNTIGGANAGARNVISGNKGDGVEIDDSNSNFVQGNYIGTNVHGKAKLGNGAAGVEADTGAAGNTIGGTTIGSGNSIAFNAEGVVIGDSTSDVETVGNSILGNSIWGNTGLGIDLGDSGHALPNGPNPLSFPNNGQNTPIISKIKTTSASGTLTSVPQTLFLLEFFATPPGGSSSQGQLFLGDYYVTTDASGNVSFTAPLAAIPKGMEITATATDMITGDTSEFSPVGT
jgi:parallel beta-helix repeat protein